MVTEMRAAVVICCQEFSDTAAEGALRLWEDPPAIYLPPLHLTDRIRAWHACPWCGQELRFSTWPTEPAAREVQP